MKKLRGSLLLILASTIWGITFIAQSDAMAHIRPFTFNCVRSLIGALVLLPVIPLFGGKRGEAGSGAYNRPVETGSSAKTARKRLFLGGILCGIALFIASNLQQFGIAVGDSIGKAGFITSFYIILVPIFGIFFRKRAPLIVWISAVIAAMGLYLLCMTEGLRVESSDLLYLGCAAFFAVHILIVSIYSPKVNGVALSCIQFAVAAVLSGICMFIFEKPSFSQIWDARTSLLYAGVLACGVSYTLQIIGQKDLDPTVASLLLCLESVVSVLAGWLVLDQTLTGREIAGCAVMFAATILAQLPTGRHKRSQRKN